MRYKCIIFDCDGVLVDSETISMGVLIEMANEVGVELSKEVVEIKFAGRSLKSIFKAIEEKATESLPEDFEQQYRGRTFKRFKEELQPVSGVHELLSKINVPYCVASSGPMNKIELNLKTTNLYQQFEGAIYSSYQINSWKPNPEIFLHAAKEMGFKPEDCVVIEDSLAGIQAAVAGGFDVFGLTDGLHKKEFENAGAKVFSNMELLDELLVKA